MVLYMGAVCQWVKGQTSPTAHEWVLEAELKETGKVISSVVHTHLSNRRVRARSLRLGLLKFTMCLSNDLS